MWKKPWKLPEGFAIGGGLVVVALLMEWSVGSVDWNVFSWPVNILVLAVFVSVIVMMHLLRKRFYPFRFLSGFSAAIPSLAYAVLMTIVMGLTRQTVDGTWLNNMLSFWPFVMAYAYLTLILGLVVLKQLSVLFNTHAPFLSRFSIISHTGLFIAITCATLGNADMQRVKMITAIGEPEWRVLDSHGRVSELPIAIELERFILERYDDGSPRRFASDIHIYTKTGKNLKATVDVNHPAEVEGWKIYQYGYDTQMGELSRTSILELVRDPWLPAVYTGIYLMIAGALLMFFRGGRKVNNEKQQVSC